MEKGEIWLTIDSKAFVIEETKQIDGQDWIFYKNRSTGQNYSCLHEAFKTRFHKDSNSEKSRIK